MIRKTVLALLLAATGVSAQALTAGDIAFTSFNADEDGWSIVALNTIAANSTIFFTDNTWNGTSFANTEIAHSWNTGTSNIAAGTVVRFSNVDKTATISASKGNISFITTANLGLSATAETVYAYVGSAWNAPTSFLAAITTASTGFNAGTATGVLTGTGLNAGTTAVAITSSTDFGQYTGVRAGQNTFAQYGSQVNNASNWFTFTGSADQAAVIPNTTAFTISAVPEPKNYAMLLAGLGLMGFIARRRSR